MRTSRFSVLWRASSREQIAAPSLGCDLAVDLAVVGGGFTGTSAALEAARSGASVCLLEAETIGHGGSGRNVGLVNAGLWLPPDAVLHQMGEEAGLRLIHALGTGPATVFELIEREGIDCEATRNGTLHLAHSPAGFKDIEERFRQGSRLGAPLSFLDARETERRTGTSIFHGALFDPRAGTIQPLAYCRGLARAAQARGARLFEHSPVSHLKWDDDAWTLVSKGRTVRARNLLVATNAYHSGIQSPYTPAFVRFNYCQFATTAVPDKFRRTILAGGEGCWDTAMVMSSIRMDRAGRLVIGGVGSMEGHGGPFHRAWARRKLSTLYPALTGLPFEHAWSGKIAMTDDHIPKIVALGPNAYACFGYSGRGIAPGTVFGTAAARALLNSTPADLPMDTLGWHTERYPLVKSQYYEIGATIYHVVSSRLKGRSSHASTR